METETSLSHISLKRKLDDDSCETELEEGDNWSSRDPEQIIEHVILTELRPKSEIEERKTKSILRRQEMDPGRDISVFFKFPTGAEFIKEELRAQEIDTQCVYPNHSRHTALRIQDWVLRSEEGTRERPLRYTMMNLFLLQMSNVETEVLKVGDLMELRIKWDKEWLRREGDGT